jgi:hypothetical protein
MIRHGQVSNDNNNSYGITLILLHCLSQEVAQLRSAAMSAIRSILGAKRTLLARYEHFRL